MHPNKKVLRDSDEAQLRGDLEAFMNGFTDEVVVHIAGKSSFASDYKARRGRRIPGLTTRPAPNRSQESGLSTDFRDRNIHPSRYSPTAS